MKRPHKIFAWTLLFGTATGLFADGPQWWTDRDVFERIAASAPGRAERVGGSPVRVRRVRVSTSMDGTVEAVAVVDDGTRCRALALRLEALQRRWLCTALEIV